MAATTKGEPTLVLMIFLPILSITLLTFTGVTIVSLGWFLAIKVPE